MTFDEFLGAEVESRFHKRNMRQEDTADVLKWSETTLKRKLHGATSLSVREILEVAAALDVPVAKVIDDALTDFGGIEKLLKQRVSDATSSNVTTLHPRDMSIERLERERHVALGLNPDATEPESD